MSQRVFRSIDEEIRRDTSYDEAWRGEDRGLITIWEVGRKLALARPDLAEAALRGEVPRLGLRAPRLDGQPLEPEWEELLEGKPAGKKKPPQEPVGWTGGVPKDFKQKKRYATFRYLAQWQGIRGDDLDINLAKEPQIVCSLTGVRVIFTTDLVKLGKKKKEPGPGATGAI